MEQKLTHMEQISQLKIMKPLRQTAIATGLFAVMSLPFMYGQTNGLVSEEGSCPTFKTRLLHLIAYFALLVYALKYYEKVERSNSDIVGYALYASLLYFLISSPELYQFVNKTIGDKLTVTNGKCPTFVGIALHSAVFSLCMAAWQTMYPEDSVYNI